MKCRLFIIIVIMQGFTGCSGPHRLAPVHDRNQPASTKVSYHVVAPGETLYSIAWRYGLDYKSLAKANSVGRSYTIFPGQKITLLSHGTHVDTSGTGLESPRVSASPTHKTHTEVVKKTKAKRLKKRPAVISSSSVSSKLDQKVIWSWPCSGPVSKAFKANNGLNKGIDITGKLGEPVYAASSGTVVYSGEGLRGYGKLIIIKHSDKFLSAYAYNSKLKVKEGDTVKTGEKIAEMGETGTDSVKLHFEIRFDGKPVNPLIHLPPRK